MEINRYNQVWSIWTESKDKLYSYILSRFKNVELAEEVTQEVLIKLHKSCCSDKEIKNLNSWLYQIAHNVALDIIKNDLKQKEIKPLVINEHDDSALKEIAMFTEPLIGLLPEKYAVPLRLSDIEGMPQKEIAEKLDLGLSATKSRIQRAREALKQEIKGCYDLELDNKGVPIEARLKDDCTPLQDFKKKN